MLTMGMTFIVGGAPLTTDLVVLYVVFATVDVLLGRMVLEAN